MTPTPEEQKTEMPVDGVEAEGGEPVQNSDELPEHS
jgi:hypothetical protein